ncbi:MAG: (2Fe-2S)-binding protein [Deltaproteobacteria bacterium]|nr:(2Fe-2S)-binding protein [Deltaproteobacteria bacterium]
MKTHSTTFFVNNKEYTLDIPVHRTLLQVLRDDLSMTDVKYGCGAGECGACTVLVDGDRPILSCLTLAVLMNGRKITTVAGLEKEGELHPVQEAFVEEGAIQCGYCTPGMVLKSVSILEKNPSPTEKDIRRGLEGNICRCTGYEKIVKAVQRASIALAASSPVKQKEGGKV